MPKRPHGEGSIRKRSDGLWEARLTLPSGQVRSFYGRTQREALAKMREARRAAEQGLSVGPERLTVRAFLTPWLEDSASGLRPTSAARYESIVRLHILPTLGRKRLKAITAQDLQALYSDKLRAGLQPSTVSYVHRVLHKALRQAVAWGLVPRNVAALVEPPRSSSSVERQALTVEQAQALLDAVREEPLGALYWLALTTGMRRGELLGLRWADVDLEARRLQVRRTLYRVKRPRARKGEPKTEWVAGEPKSSKGRRQIELLPETVDALRAHRKRQLEERLRAGKDWQDRDLVFCTGLGTPLEPGNVWRRSWRPVLERAGLPNIRLHDLRHSAASLLLALGAHPKVVQELLGHSRIGITLDTYSHVMPGLQREAIDRLGALLRRS